VKIVKNVESTQNDYLLRDWQKRIIDYFAKNPHVHLIMSTSGESGKTQIVAPIQTAVRIQRRLFSCGVRKW